MSDDQLQEIKKEGRVNSKEKQFEKEGKKVALSFMYIVYFCDRKYKGMDKVNLLFSS